MVSFFSRQHLLGLTARKVVLEEEETELLRWDGKEGRKGAGILLMLGSVSLLAVPFNAPFSSVWLSLSPGRTESWQREPRKPALPPPAVLLSSAISRLPVLGGALVVRGGAGSRVSQQTYRHWQPQACFTLQDRAQQAHHLGACQVQCHPPKTSPSPGKALPLRRYRRAAEFKASTGNSITPRSTRH